jgi:hypothetical protein
MGELDRAPCYLTTRTPIAASREQYASKLIGSPADAQSTSMRLNGLSVKPGDSLRQDNLSPQPGPVRGNFLQPFQAFFAPCFALDGLARNQAATRSTGSARWPRE